MNCHLQVHHVWPIESAYFALRHTMLHARVLRCKDPAGLQQEMWALLACYQALRMIMVDAVESVPGTDPDRAGFTIALHAARDSVITATGVTATTLVATIGTAVLAGLLPARRPRYSARKVKSPISRYHTATADSRPLTSTTITDITITIRHPAPPPRTRAFATRPRRAAPPAPTPAPGHVNTPARPQARRWPAILAVLRRDPAKAWKARDIARSLGDTANLNSFCVQMSQWARQGLIRKTAPATYMLC